MAKLTVKMFQPKAPSVSLRRGTMMPADMLMAWPMI